MDILYIHMYSMYNYIQSLEEFFTMNMLESVITYMYM